jgi:hypothetical protein
MYHARCFFLGLATILCSAGTVAADEHDGAWLNPLLARETSTRPDTSRTEYELTRFIGGKPLEWGNNRFAVPVWQEEWRVDSRRSQLVNALAIEWQHSMSTANQVTLSARYGDSLLNDADLPRATGTAAALSWSSLLGGESRISGRLFLGDQESKDRGSVNGDRRYYGLQLEGRYTLWRDHAPFASLQWQRNNYEVVDGSVPGGSAAAAESISPPPAGMAGQPQLGCRAGTATGWRTMPSILSNSIAPSSISARATVSAERAALPA